MNSKNYNYNGFEYLENFAPNSQSPIIKHNKIKPQSIFKYYALSKYSIDALINGYLYATHPIELNDLLDSSAFLLYASKKIDYDLYKKLFDPIIKDENELKEIYNNDDFNKSYISTIWELTSNLFGIISASENEFCPLMWPHYTKETGFQIKFNTEELEKSIQEKLTKEDTFMGIYPLNYTEKLSPIDISNFEKIYVPFYYLTNIKSKNWIYENEWRILVSKVDMGVPYTKKGLEIRDDYLIDEKNRYVYYDKIMVKEITLGVHFFNRRQFKIEWLNEKNFKVQVLKDDKNWKSENQKLLMDYIFHNLSDKLFYSGIKYEEDQCGKFYLVRTKEKLEIKKIGESIYILTRTDIVEKQTPK